MIGLDETRTGTRTTDAELATGSTSVTLASEAGVLVDAVLLGCGATLAATITGSSKGELKGEAGRPNGLTEKRLG